MYEIDRLMEIVSSILDRYSKSVGEKWQIYVTNKCVNIKLRFQINQQIKQKIIKNAKKDKAVTIQIPT